jgi:chemotaxis response regulator CheB
VTRVLLVDDQPLLLLGFRLVLEAQADIEVVGEAGNGRQAVAMTRALRPDVVLMDVRMPVMDGIEATREIVAAGSDSYRARVLVLTTFDLDEYVYAALRAGASGFCSRTYRPPTCCPASGRSPVTTLWWRRASPVASSTRSPRTSPTQRRAARTPTSASSASPIASEMYWYWWRAAPPTPGSRPS